MGWSVRRPIKGGKWRNLLDYRLETMDFPPDYHPDRLETVKNVIRARLRACGVPRQHGGAPRKYVEGTSATWRRPPEVRKDAPEVCGGAPEVRGGGPEVRGGGPEVRGDAPEVRGDAPEVRKGGLEVCGGGEVVRQHVRVVR